MKTAPAPAALLTVPQACQFLQMSKATLYRHMASRKNPLPYHKVGSLTRFDPGQLHRWACKK